eukprot:CAMPEP_0196135298 /NCGR_PEP_ID=MMETSP0910-20130528/3988_1 /TAXON_ID=49265 /ORGANISM="Thalassiosira rotula, Strain GSO102" /LENGTH=694 /DNA_ID=CAMNT_0041395419 /DNA_START=322 /DNA_END=2406 /DNA_ORIENTATION=+
MEMDDSSGYNKEQESRSRRRWSRKNAVLRVKKSVTVFASVIASSFLLAVKPASAVELSSILSSATELLKTATTTANPTTSPSSSYLLTRILFLRFLAIVYTAAFSVAKFQNKGLIGDNGISPARNILNAADRRGEAKSARRKEWLEQRKNYTSTASSNNSTNFVVKCKNKLLDCPPATAFRDKFWHRTDRRDRPLPTLLWFARDRNNLNPWLDGLANVGLILSAMMFATGSANVVLMLGLWLIQRSFMAVGGSFYGYGWEPQLAELTFHALFLVPMLSMNPFFGSEVVPAAAAAVAAGGVVSTSGMVATKGAFPVPTLVIYAIRWYLFKIMIGAGLIKAKSSDPKWKPGNMSAMDYFYETQPVPNPFTRYFHFMPKAWHRFEVWSNHFVELVAPFLLLMPFRSLRLAGGLIQIMFQFILISSGNLSFLNWLTIVPAIFCLDDAFLVNNLPSLVQKIALGTPTTQTYIQSVTSGAISFGQAPIARTILSSAFFVLMAKLNINVVRNLLARPQLMNASFDKLRLCGTYGAFGVVSERREELIIESANNINGPWKEYHFKVKPGDVHRRPKWISPYHHRIDWQMWIAAVSGRVERSPWIYRFLLKLLRQEKDVIGLLKSDPWKAELGAESNDDDSSNAPKYIRIEKYSYKFYDTNNATISNDDEGNKPYWVRERLGRYFPRQGVASADILEELANRH